MMTPARPRTTATYDYARDRVLYSRDIGGIHFVFITSGRTRHARAWMENDLAARGRTTPVVIFTHDQPDAQAKHFINPNGAHDINATDKFENLLADRFADGLTDRRADDDRTARSSSVPRAAPATSRRTSTATRTGTSSTTGTGRCTRSSCTRSAWTRR